MGFIIAIIVLMVGADFVAHIVPAGWLPVFGFFFGFLACAALLAHYVVWSEERVHKYRWPEGEPGKLVNLFNWRWTVNIVYKNFKTKLLVLAFVCFILAIIIPFDIVVHFEKAW